MRMLITGGRGLLGRELQGAARSAGLEVVACAHAELDVTDAALCRAMIGRAEPDVVVNCAAWTDVDGAETAERESLAVNGRGAGNVAGAAAAAGAWTCHISTDYVFDGAKSEPYVESDRPAPLSAYGRSKLAGEHAVAEAAPSMHTVVRTSWLYGAGGRSFLSAILRLAAEGVDLTVAADQIGSPTFTGHLARALVDLATERRIGGIVHLAGSGQCTRCEFATAAVKAAGLACEIRPGRGAEVAPAATRPAYSVLRSECPDVPALPHWREGLAEFVGSELAG